MLNKFLPFQVVLKLLHAGGNLEETFQNKSLKTYLKQRYVKNQQVLCFLNNFQTMLFITKKLDRLPLELVRLMRRMLY